MPAGRERGREKRADLLPLIKKIVDPVPQLDF